MDDPTDLLTDDFDPSQAQGQWEEVQAAEETISKGVQQRREEHHPSSEEEAELSEEDESLLIQLPPLRPPKRKVTPERFPSPPPAKKRMLTDISMSLASLLFMLFPIRLDKYGEAYQTFQSIPKTKGNQRFLQDLHTILSFWGDVSAMRPGTESLQNCLKEDSANALYTTIVCLSGMQRKLLDWLNAFTMPRIADSSNTDSKTKGCSSSGSTRPAHHSATTSTSYTTADGRIPPAAASPPLPYPGLQLSEEDLGLSANYRPRTSGILRSMSWRDTANCYSLRSKANNGDKIVKLEIYNSSEVMGLPSSDWWEHAECRAFVMCDKRSPIFNQAIQLKYHMRKVLEPDPDHEGDLCV
jgi:hypothetical protein